MTLKKIAASYIAAALLLALPQTAMAQFDEGTAAAKDDHSADSDRSKLFRNPPIVGKGIVNFKVKVKDYAQKPVVLGYYFDEKMLVKDTVITDNSGTASFKRDTLYDQGLYILHFPENGSVLDIIMPREQKFTVMCDTLPDRIERVQAEGSPVLKNFFDHQRFITQNQKKVREIETEFAKPGTTPQRKEELRNEFRAVDALVKERNNKVIEENRGNFLSVFLRATQQVDIPRYEPKEGLTKEQNDSLRQMSAYYYYREHFYDNFDMTDDRLLRTPFFAGKIKNYFHETVPHIPDTVAAEAIRLIEMCKSNKEMYRYFVSTMYNLVNQTDGKGLGNIMGMDAALVQIADKYYLSGGAPWAEDKFIADLRESVDGLRNILIGLKAKDLMMPSITGEWHRLSEVRAPFTVLVFWEPSCGHCKTEVPKVKQKLYDKYASKGLKVFAVYCQVEVEPWKEFIENNQLEEFINVYDPYGRSGFRKYYNIKSTPTLFVLDKDMKIIAKKLGVDQLDEFLANQFLMLEQEKQTAAAAKKPSAAKTAKPAKTGNAAKTAKPRK